MQQDNTSGQGETAVVPPEIRGWNWGAFLLNWIWGIGNNTYIALLMFIPLVNIVMAFVLGAKGNEWAWRNRTWQDVTHFKSTQRKWAQWGLAIVVLLVPLCIAIPMTAMKQSDAFKESLLHIQKSPEAIAQLGEPIKAGIFVTGNISTSGLDGRAALQYSVTGSKAEGTASVYAFKMGTHWQIKQLVVDIPSNSKQLILVAPK